MLCSGARRGNIASEIAMLTLYNAAHSTCSQKVRICLAEKSLPFDDIKLDLGNIIIDSSVICEYLDERYPAVRLTPEDAVKRAAMRAWMRFIEEVPTAG